MYRKIANWLYIHTEDKGFDVDVLTYGLEIIGATWGKTIFFLVVGLCTGYLKETALVMLVFCGLRSQAGGRHCKTSWGCSLTMLVTIFGSIFAGKLVEFPVLFILVCMMFYLTVLYKDAPHSTKNNPITKISEIKRRKRNSIIFLILIMIAEILIQDTWIRGIIFIACSIEVFSMASWKSL